MPTAVTAIDYTRLLKDVRGILESGKTEAARAVSQALVQTYWRVGQRIV